MSTLDGLVPYEPDPVEWRPPLHPREGWHHGDAVFIPEGDDARFVGFYIDGGALRPWLGRCIELPENCVRYKDLSEAQKRAAMRAWLDSIDETLGFSGRKV